MNYKIIGKYIKDLNFKIPNTKTFFSLNKDISNYKINIDIKSSQVEKNIIEVFTSINLIPLRKDFEKIDTKVVMATVIELINDQINKTELEKIILINIPTEIYSELRETFINLFEKSGFKEIKISKTVDFEKLYNLKKVQ